MLADSDVFAQTHVGTPYYMSPEQVNEKKYNEKSDIWSFGCLMYEMASLQPPFRAANHLALAMKIQQGKFATLPEHYSKELERTIRWMIQVDAEKRPAIEALLAVPRISVRYREIKLQAKQNALKQQEDDLKRREAEHDAKILAEKERLTAWEASLKEWEQRLHSGVKLDEKDNYAGRESLGFVESRSSTESNSVEIPAKISPKLVPTFSSNEIVPPHLRRKSSISNFTSIAASLNNPSNGHGIFAAALKDKTNITTPSNFVKEIRAKPDSIAIANRHKGTFV